MVRILPDNPQVSDPDMQTVTNLASGETEDLLVSQRNYAEEDKANRQDLRNARSKAEIFKVRLWNYWCIPIILGLLLIILTVLFLHIFGVIELGENAVATTGTVGSVAGVIAFVERLLRRQIGAGWDE